MLKCVWLVDDVRGVCVSAAARFSWIRLSVFQSKTRASAKYEIHVMLKMFPSTSIALEQIYNFGASVMEELMVLI